MSWNETKGPVSQRFAINRKFSYYDTQFAIELRLISIVRLIATLYETGPWGGAWSLSFKRYPFPSHACTLDSHLLRSLMLRSRLIQANPFREQSHVYKSNSRNRIGTWQPRDSYCIYMVITGSNVHGCYDVCRLNYLCIIFAT